MSVRRLLLAVLALLALGAPSLAHEVRPAFLQLRESSPQTFDVLWKVPTRQDRRLSIQPRFPDGVEVVVPLTTHVLVDAFVDRWSVRAPEGLVGGQLSIAGLASTRTDALVRIEWLSGHTQVVRLTPSSPGFEIVAAPTWTSTAWTYFVLGVEHILLGIDHLLFVLALLLLIEGWKRLVAAITAFTVAHSVTLAAATLGLVHVPGPPVEAVIALSIVFLATEVIHAKRGRDSLTKRRPWIAAFSFGLLHGLGFAGALSEVGLPESAVPLALFFFNVGVEAGQVLFVLATLLLVAIGARVAALRIVRIGEVTALGIGVIAAYWTFERIAGF